MKKHNNIILSILFLINILIILTFITSTVSATNNNTDSINVDLSKISKYSYHINNENGLKLHNGDTTLFSSFDNNTDADFALGDPLSITNQTLPLIKDTDNFHTNIDLDINSSIQYKVSNNLNPVKGQINMWVKTNNNMTDFGEPKYYSQPNLPSVGLLNTQHYYSPEKNTIFTYQDDWVIELDTEGKILQTIYLNDVIEHLGDVRTRFIAYDSQNNMLLLGYYYIGNRLNKYIYKYDLSNHNLERIDTLSTIYNIIYDDVNNEIMVTKIDKIEIWSLEGTLINTYIPTIYNSARSISYDEEYIYTQDSNTKLVRINKTTKSEEVFDIPYLNGYFFQGRVYDGIIYIFFWDSLTNNYTNHIVSGKINSSNEFEILDVEEISGDSKSFLYLSKESRIMELNEAWGNRYFNILNDKIIEDKSFAINSPKIVFDKSYTPDTGIFIYNDKLYTIKNSNKVVTSDLDGSNYKEYFAKNVRISSVSNCTARNMIVIGGKSNILLYDYDFNLIKEINYNFSTRAIASVCTSDGNRLYILEEEQSNIIYFDFEDETIHQFYNLNIYRGFGIELDEANQLMFVLCGSGGTSNRVRVLKLNDPTQSKQYNYTNARSMYFNKSNNLLYVTNHASRILLLSYNSETLIPTLVNTITISNTYSSGIYINEISNTLYYSCFKTYYQYMGKTCKYDLNTNTLKIIYDGNDMTLYTTSSTTATSELKFSYSQNKLIFIPNTSTHHTINTGYLGWKANKWHHVSVKYDQSIGEICIKTDNETWQCKTYENTWPVPTYGEDIFLGSGNNPIFAYQNWKSSIDNFEIMSGTITGEYQDGKYLTEVIDINGYDVIGWDRIEVEEELNGGSITYDLYDPDTESPIEGYTGLVANSPVDISTLSLEHKQIRVMVNITPNGNVSPELHSMQIVWKNREPELQPTGYRIFLIFIPITFTFFYIIKHTIKSKNNII